MTANNTRLSQISTLWTVLEQAHGGSADESVAAARELLVRRYGGAVRRYLLACLRDADAADELTNEFALALIQGQFRHADRRRGRFRDYVKASLRNLISQYRHQNSRRPHLLAGDDVALTALAAPDRPDALFESSWREDLLARALETLGQVHPVAHAVLHHRIHNEGASIEEMIEPLTRHLGRPFTADGLRQTLHRARKLFRELLLDAVRHSLDPGTPEQVEEELGELGLLGWLRP